MGTRALDLTTIWIALIWLEERVIAETAANAGQWKGKAKELSSEIKFILGWLSSKNKKLLSKIKDLNVKISFDAEKLNKMLKEANFSGSIEELGINKMGFVSILDKTTRWLEVADKCKIQTKVGEKPGFRLRSKEVGIYEVDGYKKSILVRPYSKTENNIWFFLHDDPNIKGVEMSKLAFDVMNKEHWVHSKYEGAKVPKIDFEVKPNIKWLTELMFHPDTQNINDAFFLNEAKQIFKLRMDEKGARVKVVTFGSGIIGSAIRVRKEILIIDRPFYGWWTQNYLEELPMAPFYADYYCWKEPAGSLEDL